MPAVKLGDVAIEAKETLFSWSVDAENTFTKMFRKDDFFEYAVGKSAGSLSPRAKWEHQKNYEFKLVFRLYDTGGVLYV